VEQIVHELKNSKLKDKRSNTNAALSLKPCAKSWTKIPYPSIKRTLSFLEDQYKKTPTMSGSSQSKSTKNLSQDLNNGKWIQTSSLILYIRMQKQPEYKQEVWL
jgi:hypothetical protein